MMNIENVYVYIFRFWRNCCKAFAFQCIEKHLTLLAIPYLLAINDVTQTINILCEMHYYREAWVVAKLYREPEDEKIYEKVSTEWIHYLESQGNLEGAALM